MAFKYHEAVPWGRPFEEYRRMFGLSDADLKLRIAGCGDGPASFNAEMFQRGCRVVSCDPIYKLSTMQIQERINITYDDNDNMDPILCNQRQVRRAGNCL
jgi:hypothetical protein